MLTLKQVEKALGEPASAWKGRCFEIASAIMKAGLVKGRAVYGHWRGPVHKRSMFFRSSGLGWVQHGWVELDDGSVLDPTRWAFENKKPYLYQGASDHYDEGGNIWRSQQAGPPPVYEEFDECRDVDKRIMDGPTYTFVEKLLRLDLMRQEPGVLTVDQLRWLAHVPPSVLGQHAKGVYDALEKLGMSAFIPIDNQRMVEAKPEYVMGVDIGHGGDATGAVIARKNLDGTVTVMDFAMKREGEDIVIDVTKRTGHINFSNHGAKDAHPRSLVHRGRGRRSNG